MLAAAPAGPAGGGMQSLIFLLLIIVVFYFFMIRPQMKKQKEATSFRSSLQKGDKVAIISENRPEWVYSDFAILEIGGIDVPLFPSLTADSIEFILNNSEAKGVIISNKFQLNKIRKIIPVSVGFRPL